MDVKPILEKVVQYTTDLDISQMNHSSSTNEVKKNEENNTENISKISLKEAVQEINKKIESSNVELKFSLHEKTKWILIKLVNKKTQETIREIPSEKIVDMMASMCEMAGLIIDEKK